jgi:hypothetical protein
MKKGHGPEDVDRHLASVGMRAPPRGDRKARVAGATDVTGLAALAWAFALLGFVAAPAVGQVPEAPRDAAPAVRWQPPRLPGAVPPAEPVDGMRAVVSFMPAAHAHVPHVPLAVDERSRWTRPLAIGAVAGGGVGGVGAWLALETADDPIGSRALVVTYGALAGALAGAGVAALVTWLR